MTGARRLVPAASSDRWRHPA